MFKHESIFWMSYNIYIFWGWFFRVDLCHQNNNDEDEEEGCSPREALLEKMEKPNSSRDRCRRCCSFRLSHIGSRQKVVLLVPHLFKILHLQLLETFLFFSYLIEDPVLQTVHSPYFLLNISYDFKYEFICDFVFQATLLIFALMLASSVLMWLGIGEENPIDPLTVSRVWTMDLCFFLFYCTWLN